jgi:hypothetical protein
VKSGEKNEDGCDYQEEENNIIEIRSDFCDDEQEDDINEQEETANKIFINPTRVETNDGDLRIICENCDFRARSKSKVNNHRLAKHNWCSFCFLSLISQGQLKKHLKNKHNKQ